MVKKVLGVILMVLFVAILTVVTQTGGLLFVLFILIWKIISKRTKRFQHLQKWLRILIKSSSFILFYLSVSFLITPIIAKQFDRVPLPIFSNPHLKPLNLMTCLMNRHYVKTDLYNAIEEVSADFATQHPESVVAYLDANFPFFDGFPLLPHKSHNDGEKIDLALLFKDTKSGTELNDAAPSFIGYGVFEEPLKGEQNQPQNCSEKGYWQYSILSAIVPQWNKTNYTFDKSRTKTLIELFSNHSAINKVFIEPHLKSRMHLTSSKVRYHGCGAVRHDDHIHIQL